MRNIFNLTHCTELEVVVTPASR